MRLPATTATPRETFWTFVQTGVKNTPYEGERFRASIEAVARSICIDFAEGQSYQEVYDFWEDGIYVVADMEPDASNSDVDRLFSAVFNGARKHNCP